MALVGGLVLGISSKHNEKHPEATPMQKFRPHLFFNLGRVLGFAFLGGILGMIGSVFQPSSITLGSLTIFIGLVMLIMGLQLIEIFPWANHLKLVLPKSLSRLLGIFGHQKEYSHRNSIIIGALTFFLPCGFTQTMQVYAVGTGSFWGGAVVMGLFALGTVPGLLGIGGLTSVVKGISAKRFFKLAGLAVIIFAIFNISNGLGLTGWTFAAAPSSNSQDAYVTLENGIQVVRMSEVAGGYEPNSFTIKRGIPVKWVIDAQSPYSCAATIVLPKYNIRKSLEPGENIINFIPTEIGPLKFSCSMGMYRGVFNVVDENTGTAAKPVAVAKSNTGSCGASGGGCGCGGGAAAKSPAPANGQITSATTNGNEQVIKTTYTSASYLNPSAFKVKAGVKVRFEIDVRDDGVGCGNAIAIPELYNSSEPLLTGVPIVMEFTPITPGSYDITCGMGMIRYGSIIVE